MAHKKAGGTAAGNRDSHGKRLGVKLFGGTTASPGKIIVRQVGTKFFSGNGTRFGRDYTIFATKTGTVKFGKRQGRKVVTVT